MNDRRLYFMEHLDELRLFLMNEPRGHAAMSGAILQPPTRPDCDWGVVYIEVSGCLPMCGHGTIGVATVLVETGMVDVVEPVTEIRLDTPAGLVVAQVAVSDGHADSVTIENVPSFVDGARRDGRGARLRHRPVLDGVRRQLLRARRPRRPQAALRPGASAGPARRRARDHGRDQRDGDAEAPASSTASKDCHHVELIAPGSDARHSRHAMAI